MFKGISASTEKFLLDVSRLQRRTMSAQQQITSGLRLQRVSDAPDQVSSLMDTRASLERVRQVGKNLGRVKTEVDTAEKAMQSAVSLLERARTLASQGASGHQNAATRAQVAAELQGILQRMVAVTATTVEGRYIFAGDNDQAPPYELDPYAPSGVTPYLGSASTRKIADASGTPFDIAKSANLIFDTADPERNVFTAINGMRRALLAVDSPPDPPDPTIPTLDQALRNLAVSSQHLNEQLAGYGLIQNRVSESVDASTQMELNLRKQIADVEEADLAEAAIELTQSNTNLEAAMSARARVPRRSLFDYLG